VIFTFLGVTYLLPGLHAYAWGRWGWQNWTGTIVYPWIPSFSPAFRFMAAQT